MNKKYALSLSLLITLLLIFSLYFVSYAVKDINSNSLREKAIISRVIDGDTLVLDNNKTIRLVNINSPEKNLPISNLATDFLKSFENRSAEIEIIGADKYGRYLARVYAPDYINLKIVESGLASKFLVQKSELNKFANAEKNAIKNNLGIWKPSRYGGCFETSIDKYNEIVIIRNKCQINMAGFTLKDESRKTYSFGNISFSKINLHSSSGNDNSTDIFWNTKMDIWNNDRDTLYLFDKDGGIAHHESYGY